MNIKTPFPVTTKTPIAGYGDTIQSMSIPEHVNGAPLVSIPWKNPYEAYELCEEKDAPLSGFRLVFSDEKMFYVLYHDLVTFEASPTTIRLKTPRLEFLFQGINLDCSEFFDALATQSIRLITQWDEKSDNPVIDKRMCVQKIIVNPLPV